VSAPDRASVLRQVAAVQAEVAAAARAAGRDPATIRIIAVTKSQGPEVLPWLAEAGIRDCGENRIEHLAAMRASPGAAGLRFHAIGRVQGRQFADLVPLADELHSLADPGHLDRLVRAVIGTGRGALPVFIQVNTSGEAAKAGGTPADAERLAEAIRSRPELDLQGLMTMAPPRGTVPDEAILAAFTRLAELGRRLGTRRLSMGMSDDFPLAIQAGATDLRIGSRLFLP
jgi:pyridoxal phosphate enzyme (YggS family)